ncbi:helix-turn-helix transcriptional regulator [Paenibacillus sp. FSL W8-0186]|uniref:HTH cro/C1-type domain-containing protein n=1 Tax=Paenibacillus woosongensis TaxID=307580 RepID=A0ABQ4MR99_9BACL|nr:helix-turn-helix transcriptional regulator [Paenibacillus woosongensis]GIP58531.1 hypothetical protein J15TS10_23450 [Paenibacillus woosongensis]
MLRTDRLKNKRLEKKLTQEDMANKLDITRQAYGNYESGKRDVDSTTLVKLVEILDIDSDYLLGITDTPRSLATNMSFYGGSKNYTPDEIAVMEATLKAYRQQLTKMKEDKKK